MRRRLRAQVMVVEEGQPARNRNLGHLGQIHLEEAGAAEGGAVRGTFTLKGVGP